MSDKTGYQRTRDQRFREPAESIRDIFWIAATDELLYVNPAHEKIWGMSCESLLENPAPFRKVVHPEDRERVRLAFRGSFEGKGPSSVEFRIIGRNKTMRRVLVHFFPLRRQGRPERKVGIAQDVTAARHTEEFVCLERDLALRLAVADDLAKAMKYLLKACLQLGVLDSGAIYTVERETGALNLICHVGLADGLLKGVPFYDCPFPKARFAMKDKTGHWSKPLGIPEVDDLLGKEGIVAFLAIPVIYRAEVIAALYLASHSQPEIPQNVRAAVEVLANHIGEIIRRLGFVDKIKARSKRLEEESAALKVLIKPRKEDRDELEASLLKNVKVLITPYMEKLKKSRLADDQKSLVQVLESHLLEITSPFAHKISASFLGLTPTEIRIANLIRQKRSSKEIAEILRISEYAVIFHRQGIRRKLGLTGKKLNLQTHLGTLPQS